MKTLEKSAKIKVVYSVILSVFITVTLLVACEDEEPVKYPSQLFRPVEFIASVSDAGELVLKWTPINTATYLLDYARDEAFTLDIQSIAIENPEYQPDDLWSETNYWARVKSVSKNPNIKDSDFRTITFTAPSENIFFPLMSMGLDWVLLEWNPDIPLTHIKMTTNDDGATAVDIILSDTEIAIGKKRVEGLTLVNNAETSYKFTLYQGQRKRGSMVFQRAPNP